MPAIKPELFRLLNSISRVTTRHNLESYIVGGFVRDWLLGRDTYDIDIAINGDVRLVARELAQDIDGKYVLLDDANNVVRVIIAGPDQTWQLDFTGFSDGLRNDLARRDFTINAIAVDLSNFISGSHEMIDPFCGEEDIKNKTVRAVSSQIFKEDAVRLLRAVRFAAELGFGIEAGTENLIIDNSELVGNVPGEKLRDEILRLLSLSCFRDRLLYLDELHLLTGIIPELGEMKDVAQPKEHYWDVFNHSIETVAAVEFLLLENDWPYSKQDLLKESSWLQDIRSHFEEEISGGSNRRQMLKLGCLLHDVAKPQSKTVDDTGRMRFIGHPGDGADIVVEILNRLRFSGKEIKLVKNLVYYHLRPVQMANTGMPTSKAVYRYFRDTGTDGLDILVLALADYLATCGPRINVTDWKRHNELIRYIMAENNKQKIEVLAEKLVDGHDLMKTFCLTQGPLIGKLLDLVQEAHAAGEINTREEAILLVSRELKIKDGGGLSDPCRLDDSLDRQFCIANELRKFWTIE